MSSTKTQVIAKFSEIYPECESTLATTLFDDANKRIATRMQYRNSTIDVDLVAGQAEYDYDPNGVITMVHECYLLKTSQPSSWLEMRRQNVDKYANLRPNWRANVPNGDPFEYYINSAPANSNSTGGQGTLGLYPPPNYSTLGTNPNDYPKIRLWVTTTAPMAGSDNVPVNLIDDYIYVWQMCEWYAKQRKPEDLPRWFDANMRMPYSEVEFQKNIAMQKDMQTYEQTVIQPGWCTLGGVRG